MQNLSIYVHIPFCNSKCNYCNFYSITDKGYASEYVNTLIDELAQKSATFKDRQVVSVYFGGGTPSCIDAKYIKNILFAIEKYYNVTKTTEVTMEANPNTLNEKNLSVYLKSGINRFSLGMQSVNNDILKKIGRSHTIEDIYSAIQLLHKNSITNINLDIMLGLEDQTTAGIDKFINIIKEYDIPHISAYSLKVEEGTLLEKMVNKGEYVPQNEDGQVDLYDYLRKNLHENGINRYEVSNFCKSGYECKHNLAYWFCDEYLGVGATAHSFYNDTRYSNTATVNEYISGKFVHESQFLTPDELEYDYIMLALRTKYGISFEEYYNRFSKDFLVEYWQKIHTVKQCFDISDTNFTIKDEFFYVMNSLLLKLLYTQ